MKLRLKENEVDQDLMMLNNSVKEDEQEVSPQLDENGQPIQKEQIEVKVEELEDETKKSLVNKGNTNRL